MKSQEKADIAETLAYVYGNTQSTFKGHSRFLKVQCFDDKFAVQSTVFKNGLDV